MKKGCLFLFYLLFISLKLFAQADELPGTWRMDYLPAPPEMPVTIELQIAAPQKSVLYPAHLKLQCDSFNADYGLLLVKKDSRQLAISKNKYVISEGPFSLGNCTAFLNGVFDQSRDFKEVPLLTAIRIASKQLNFSMPDTMHLTKAQKITAIHLRDFLKDADIQLKKINNIPWQDENSERILSPSISPYLGLLDTVHLQTRDGSMNLSSEKKEDDIVSVSLNGRLVIDQLAVNRKKHTEDILLDTGVNILTFFADNFGDQLPNKGKLNLQFNNQKFTLDFANRVDSAATFITAKFYCDKDEAQEKIFQNYTPTGADNKPLQKNENLLSSIVATSQQVMLAVWDDAVEDGDSVSININGKWIAQGLPVKIKPQFITVALKPGPNTITFVADNLGSIPPNTSVLEIIDGKKRKSFTIETTPEDKNLIKIFYDVQPAQ